MTISNKIKESAKKQKISLTYMRGGKRYKKTEKMLSRQLKKGGSSLTDCKEKKNMYLDILIKIFKNPEIKKLLFEGGQPWYGDKKGEHKIVEEIREKYDITINNEWIAKIKKNKNSTEGGSKKVSKSLQAQAKKGGVALTYMRGGKRYKKTEKMLSRQLNKKVGGDGTELKQCIKDQGRYIDLLDAIFNHNDFDHGLEKILFHQGEVYTWKRLKTNSEKESKMGRDLDSYVTEMLKERKEILKRIDSTFDEYWI